MTEANYYAYWGKARAGQSAAAPYHLLVYHSLDVAACGQQLLKLPRFSVSALAEQLGWPLVSVERVAIFFWLIHDLGKFARAFQNLAPNLAPDLVPAVKAKRYSQRHDCLGWLLWRDQLSWEFPQQRLPQAEHEFWAVWARTAFGHHGQPPREQDGSLPLESSDFYLEQDQHAAQALVAELAEWWLDIPLPTPTRAQLAVLRRYSWRLAGLAVLADWLGSNPQYFPYQTQPMPLRDYWASIQTAAQQAVSNAGLSAQPIQPWQGAVALLGEYLQQPTPLQHYATHMELSATPQLFLLEDVTGAGKTEAALILSQRLMAAGLAQGLYFALPTMATANQMYQRVGIAYRRFYQPQAQPSLILAHGARQLVAVFRQSILQGFTPEQNYQSHELSAGAQCQAWLADNRKKALLADVGVGTLDQALLAVMSARHQALRLLGLGDKLLIVDEVHAYDRYMLTLLKCLLTAHAQQGGSAILLSATLPAQLRAELIAAFERGRGIAPSKVPDDLRYPLLTHVGAEVSTHACATRPELERRVEVAFLHQEAAALQQVLAAAAAGQAVCWIRNTVDDARCAYAAIRAHIPNSLLFHSRFAMGDRLAIEAQVLQRFGKASTFEQRQGQVLIATQVVEQSLDLDFDCLISDLAPIDLLIQRAGRLQRHQRTHTRPAPCLWLLCPEWSEQPSADWYSRLFPSACYVYPDVGRLWLTQAVLQQARALMSPGVVGQVGAVRYLVEAVYGVEDEQLPAAFARASRELAGKNLAKASQAHYNALDLTQGYQQENGYWEDDRLVLTRLSEEDNQTLYLARVVGDQLQPWCAAGEWGWENSLVRVNARQFKGLAVQWEQRFAEQLTAIGRQHPWLAYELIVPLLADQDGTWYALTTTGTLRYDPQLGVLLERA